MAASSQQTTTLKIDADTKQRLKQLALAKNRTPHGLMCEAIAQYVTREEQRERFHQNAREAWEEYTKTGLHINAEEADVWLAKLESGLDTKAPICHS